MPKTERALLILTSAIGGVLVLGLGAGLYFLFSHLAEIEEQEEVAAKKAQGLRDARDRTLLDWGRPLSSPGGTPADLWGDQWVAITAEREDWRTTLDQIKQRLPTEADVTKATTTLAKKCHEFDIELVGYSKEEDLGAGLAGLAGLPGGGPLPNFERIVYSVKFTGPYLKLVEFLHALEEPEPQERWFAIEDMRLDAYLEGKVPQTRKHALKVKLVVYRYLSKSGPDGTAGGVPALPGVPR